jgi:hypothetical protein
MKGLLMNVTVIGGGNIGAAMAANLSLIAGVSVTLWTRKPERFTSRIHIVNREKGIEYESGELIVTDNVETAVQGADVIFCTVPAFARKSYITQMKKHLKPDVLLGFVPGSGGIEFICKEMITGVTIFALQRVPYTTRNLEYGKVCAINSTKPTIYTVSIPTAMTSNICNLMQKLLGIPCVPLHNYLEATLVPSNAILHTSRIFSLFKDYIPGKWYNNNPFFYLDWTDEASEVLFACDAELQNVCRSYNELDLSGVVSLKEHYESAAPSQLTNKLSAMPAFIRSSTCSPMVESSPGKWEPDWESRYFKEDFPYGLAIIKGLAAITGVSTPTIDSVLFWYQDTCGHEYFMTNGRPGKHIGHCGAPQRYGFTDKSQILELYR